MSSLDYIYGPNSNEPDYIYYNLDIINSQTDVESTSKNPDTIFNETRTQPILQNCSNYEFSIIRFTMNGPNKTLPIFIPVIQTGPNQDNPNKTVYAVRCSMEKLKDRSGVQTIVEDTASNVVTDSALYDYQTRTSISWPGAHLVEKIEKTVTSDPHYLHYYPENKMVKRPQLHNGKQNIESGYYFVYTYSHWLEIVNRGFEKAHADLISKWNDGVFDITDTHAPYLKWNGEGSNTFSLYVDVKLYENDKYNYKIHMNTELFGMFSGFAHTHHQHNDSGVDYELSTSNPHIHAELVDHYNNDGTKKDTMWRFTQDYESTSSLWNPVGSIVFCSTLIPLRPEATGQPNYYSNSTNVGGSRTTQGAFQPIITDINLTNKSASDYRQFLGYAPSSEYRLSSFFPSSESLSNIDVQVYWKYRLTGELFSLKMFNLSSVSIKIMLRKRGAKNPFM